MEARNEISRFSECRWILLSLEKKVVSQPIGLVLRCCTARCYILMFFPVGFLL